ncbi:MAG: hypothetical protein INR66_26335, partial [Gordonia polyisoprenivorans]|nr:hypothetical protein [Gordonia polyisoprenivorans]
MTSIDVQHHALHIDGKAVDTDESMTIVNPADASVVATVAKGTASHIDD